MLPQPVLSTPRPPLQVHTLSSIPIVNTDLSMEKIGDGTPFVRAVFDVAFLLNGLAQLLITRSQAGAVYLPLLTTCNPITEITSVERKNIRQNVTGSLNTTMPAITVPMAPMAPQTA